MYQSKYNKVFELGDDRSVIYNTLSGAIDVVDCDPFSGEIDLASEGSQQLRGYLEQRGYLFEAEGAEKKELDRLHAAYRDFIRRIRPLIFYVVVTYTCNLRCHYCFQGPVKNKKDTFRPEDLGAAFQAIKLIRQRHAETRTKPVVALFGGEPLLKRNLVVVERILDRVSTEGFVNGPIISNGVELDEFLPLFQRFRPSGVQVTLDGPRDVHDRRRIGVGGEPTFDRIVANVHRALGCGVKIGVRTNVDQDTVGALPRLVEFVDRQGWIGRKDVELNLAPVHHRPCGTLDQSRVQAKLLERVLGQMREIPELQRWNLDGWTVVNYFRRLLDDDQPVLPRFDHCEAAVGKSYHLDMYGKIYTCIEACGIEQYAAGRFLPTLEFYELYERLRNRHMMNMERCRSCNLALVCGGGCALQSLYDHHTTDTPLCGNIERDLASYVRFRFREERRK